MAHIISFVFQCYYKCVLKSSKWWKEFNFKFRKLGQPFPSVKALTKTSSNINLEDSIYSKYVSSNQIIVSNFLCYFKKMTKQRYIIVVDNKHLFNATIIVSVFLWSVNLTGVCKNKLSNYTDQVCHKLLPQLLLHCSGLHWHTNKNHKNISEVSLYFITLDSTLQFWWENVLLSFISLLILLLHNLKYLNP